MRSTLIPTPEIVGWLACAGDLLAKWELYWFVLKDDVLFSFNGEGTQALGAISLAGFKARAAAEEVKDKCAIKAYHTDGRTHFFVAGSKDDASAWIKALSKAAGGLGVAGASPRAVTINPRKSSKSLLTDVQAAVLPQPEMAIYLNEPPKENVGMRLTTKLVKLQITTYLVEDPAVTVVGDSKKSTLARILSEPTDYPKDDMKRRAGDILTDTGSEYLSQNGRWELVVKSSFFSTLLRKNKKDPLTKTNSRSSLKEAFATTSPVGSPTTSPVGSSKDILAGAASNTAENGGSKPAPHPNAGSSSSLEAPPPAEAVTTPEVVVSPRKKVGWQEPSEGDNSSGAGGGSDQKKDEEAEDNVPEKIAPLTKRSRSTDALATRAARRMSVAAMDSENRAKLLRPEWELAAVTFKEGWILRASQLQDGEEPRRTWFLLDDNFLRAYESDESTNCVLEVDMDACTLEERDEASLHLAKKEGLQEDRKYTLEEALLLVFEGGEAERGEWLEVFTTAQDDYLRAQRLSVNFEGEAEEATGAEALKKAASEEFNQEVERMVTTFQSQEHGVPSPMVATARESQPHPTPDEEGKKDEQAGEGQLTAVPEPTVVLQEPPGAVPAVLPATVKEIKKDRAQLIQEALERRQTVLVQREVVKEKDKGFTPPKSQLDKEKLKEYALKLEGGEEGEEGASKRGSVVLTEENGLVIEYSVEGGKVDEYNVTGGTLDVLVSRLADENHPNTNYIDIFLLTYRHLLTARDFMERLITRFNVIPPPDATPEELAYYDRWAGVIKVRTMGVVKKWIDNYWLDFHQDEETEAVLLEFLQLASNDSPVLSLVERLRRIIEQRKEELRAASLAALPGKALASPSKPLKVDFFTVDPREFAYQLTLTDYDKFHRILPSEFVARLWEGVTPASKNLTEMIDFFNRMSYFTATTICVQPNLKTRARILETFIRALKECRRIRNFNGAMAILSGLSTASVRRLKKTWAAISPKHTEELTEIEVTMSAEHNFKKYREIFGEMERQPRPGPCIPFMGLFLRDLTFLNDGNPRKFKSGLYNFAKLRMISDRVLRMHVYQTAPYSFPASGQSTQLRAYLQETSAVMADENALYKCSLLCEPKEGEGERMIERWAADAENEKEKTKKAQARGRRQSVQN